MTTKLNWWEDEEQIKKLASSDASLEVIEAVIKEAARQNELKDVYADFDAAGRIMAHGYYSELKKLAEVEKEAATTVAPVEFPKTDGCSTEPVPFQPNDDHKDKSGLKANEKKLKEKKYAALKELLHRNG